MIVPAWASSWELDCCQPEAEVGGRWSVPVAFAAIDYVGGPGDHRRDFTAGLPDDERRRGMVELDILRVSPPDAHEEVWGAGPLRFRGHGLIDGHRHTGYLELDAHNDDDHEVDVICDGLVTAVHLVPVRYARVGPRSYEPAEQLAAIPVTTTRQRFEVDTDPSALSNPAEPYIITDLLVTLDVDDDGRTNPQRLRP